MPLWKYNFNRPACVFNTSRDDLWSSIFFISVEASQQQFLSINYWYWHIYNYILNIKNLNKKNHNIMKAKEIKKLVDLINRGFKKMEEFNFLISPIYGFMLRFLVTPRGTKIAIKAGINVSRQIKNGTRYFRIDYNKKRPLLLPANTPEEIQSAILWMEQNNCLPRMKAFKTVIMPRPTIKV